MYTQQPASQFGANHCQPSLIASRTAAIYNCVRGGDIISFRLANHMVCCAMLYYYIVSLGYTLSVVGFVFIGAPTQLPWCASKQLSYARRRQ